MSDQSPPEEFGGVFMNVSGETLGTIREEIDALIEKYGAETNLWDAMEAEYAEDHAVKH